MAPTKYPMALLVFQLNDIEHKNGQRKKRFHIRAHKAFGIFYGTWNCAESTIFVAISLSHTLPLSHSLHVFSFSLFYFSNGFSGLLANNSHCFTWRRTMKCHRKCEMTVDSGHGIKTFFFRLFSFLYVFNSKAKCQSFYYLALIQWIRKQKGRKKERDRREKKDKHKMCATIKQLALYWTHSQREAKRKTNEHIVNQFWKKGGMCQI